MKATRRTVAHPFREFPLKSTADPTISSSMNTEGCSSRFALATVSSIALFVAAGCGAAGGGWNASSPAVRVTDATCSQRCAEDLVRTAPAAVDDDVAVTLSKSCGSGDMAACSILGVAYELGRGVARNQSLAERLYRQACDGGNARGCGNRGELVLAGSAPGSSDQGLALVFQACEGGSGRHCGLVGRTYAEGVIVPLSPSTAASFLEHGCLRGDTTSCLGVADIFDQGLVPAAPGRAHVLVAAACSLGDRAACDRAEKLGKPPALTASADRRAAR